MNLKGDEVVGFQVAGGPHRPDCVSESGGGWLEGCVPLTLWTWKRDPFNLCAFPLMHYSPIKK